MKKILVIKSSITGDNSHSNKYVDKLIADHQKQGHEIIIRDVAKNPVPLFNANLMSGFQGNQQFANEVAVHNALIDEILSADELIIGAPMYNFSIPVQLKAYIDAISRAGATFKYTDTGPVGLLKAKKAIFVFSRGGLYHANGYTNQEDYLKMVFSFLGVKSFEYVFVEGTAMGADKVQITQKAIAA